MKFKFILPLLFLFGAMATMQSCVPDDVGTELQTPKDVMSPGSIFDVKYTETNPVGEESYRQWEFIDSEYLLIYAKGNPSNGYVEKHRYRWQDENTLITKIQGMYLPQDEGGTYMSDAYPQLNVENVFSLENDQGSIKGVNKPEGDFIPTNLLFKLE